MTRKSKGTEICHKYLKYLPFGNTLEYTYVFSRKHTIFINWSLIIRINDQNTLTSDLVSSRIDCQHIKLESAKRYNGRHLLNIFPNNFAFCKLIKYFWIFVAILYL